MSLSKTRLHWAGLVFVVLLATAFRVVAIDRYGLDTDEAWTLALSMWTPWEMLTLPTDTHPFLYYSLHRWLFSPDDAVASMRLLSVLFGVLAVGVMYLLGRLYFGVFGSLLGAALLAVWTSHVDYSMEVRNYAAFSFFILLMFYGFGLFWQSIVRDWSRTNRLTGLIVFSLGCVLCFYTHIISVFPIAFLCASLWLGCLFFARERLWEASAALGIMALCAVPGVVWALKVVTGDHMFNWWEQPSFASFVSTVADFFYPAGLWDNDLTNDLGLRREVKAVLFVVYTFYLAGLFTLRRSQIADAVRAAPALGVSIGLLLAMPLVIWAVGFVASPIFIGRTILFCVPGLILLLVAAVSADSAARNVVLGLVFVALYAVSTTSFGFMREKLDWRGAVAFLEENVGPDDYIGLTPSYNYLTLSRPASKPTGAGLWITSSAGKPVVARHGLGSDPGWVENYYHTLERREKTSPVTVDLPSGTTIWRVDGPVSPRSPQKQSQNHLFERIGKPETVWRQRNKFGEGDWLSIQRYRTNKPVTLEMQMMVDAAGLKVSRSN